MTDKQYEAISEKFSDLSEKELAALYFLTDNIDFVEQLSQGEKWTEAAYKNLMAKAEERDDALMKIFIIYKYNKDHGVVSQ